MNIETKKIIIAVVSLLFLASLLLVQWKEISRQRVESGHANPHIAVPDSSKRCVECHTKQTPSVVSHWKKSTHAVKGVSCLECHTAHEKDADSFVHEGHRIATIVTPKGLCSLPHAGI